MYFKEEIKIEVELKIEPIDIGSVNIHINEYKNETDLVISLYWYSKDNEFEYVYSGSKTMFRWLKGKCYTDKCKTPKSIKELYNKIYNEQKEIYNGSY